MESSGRASGSHQQRASRGTHYGGGRVKKILGKLRGQRIIALAASVAASAIGLDLYAGTTGSAVTISLSGSTAIRNFTTSEGFSFVNPNSVVNIGGVNYPAATTDWGPPTSLSSFQLAPFNASGAVTTGSQQAANALRIEWHEQGSVEGILEMVNDQIAPIGSITATDRNPTSGNPLWINRNKFDGSAGKAAGSTVSGFFLGAVNTVGGGATGVAQFNLNGTTANNSHNAVQMGISDVNARQVSPSPARPPSTPPPARRVTARAKPRFPPARPPTASLRENPPPNT